MDTPSLLKDTFFSILVDSSERLGNSVASGDISLGDLNTIIDGGKKTPPYFSLDLARISMTHTVSLAQIGSLFIRHRKVYTPEIPLDSVPSRAYTGILIDARGSVQVHGEYGKAPLVPCLFPKVWSTGMDLLYDKSMVERETALSRGIVFYSSSTDESRYRDQIGPDPIRISAREIYGQHRTDPVISETEYLRIMSVAANRELLHQGKVVILCNPEQLESLSVGPDRDENYYFTRREITESLNASSVQHVDFSDTWEGLKLTIYDIRFEADSARILPQEEGRLDAIAEALALAGPSARFLVEGHTASVGKPAAELALSVQRASRIAGELAARGIGKERIESTGYGGTRPVASNDTDQGRTLNRRVEITIHLADRKRPAAAD